MKMKILVAALVAMSLASTGVAFGQGRDERGGDQGPRANERDNRGNDQRQQPQQQQRPNRANDNNQRNDPRNNQRNNQRYDQRPEQRAEQRDERGAGPSHAFHRGDRLPPEYRQNQYVVDDWRGHNLSAPPRGYHWVQTGGDYVLAAVATGVILQLLLGH